MRKLPSVAVVLTLGLIATARQAPAAIFTYTEQVTASGSLGSASYTNQPVTLTFTGNTANVVHNSGYATLFPGTATVKVGGGATATFINDTFGAVANVNNNAGIYDVSLSATILSAANAVAVGTYDLTTPIAFTGTSFSRGDLVFPTSLGGFVIASTSSNATFTAVAVPEPLAIACLALATPLLLRRRRP